MQYTRQADLIKCDMRTPITVVGAGGIGSFTVLTLAKMGFNDITVYDFDKVEEHNLSSQFYRTEDLGSYKVDALLEIVESFADVELRVVAERFEPASFEMPPGGVLIAAVDTMLVRRELYDWFIEHPDCALFVDGRMGADQAEVYTVDREHHNDYASRLWLDSETAALPCTSKATMYNVLTIASLIANHVRLSLMNEPVRWAVVVDNRNVQMHYIQ